MGEILIQDCRAHSPLPLRSQVHGHPGKLLCGLSLFLSVRQSEPPKAGAQDLRKVEASLIQASLIMWQPFWERRVGPILPGHLDRAGSPGWGPRSLLNHPGPLSCSNKPTGHLVFPSCSCYLMGRRVSGGEGAVEAVFCAALAHSL